MVGDIAKDFNSADACVHSVQTLYDVLSAFPNYLEHKQKCRTDNRCYDCHNNLGHFLYSTLPVAFMKIITKSVGFYQGLNVLVRVFLRVFFYLCRISHNFCGILKDRHNHLQVACRHFSRCQMWTDTFIGLASHLFHFGCGASCFVVHGSSPIQHILHSRACSTESRRD